MIQQTNNIPAIYTEAAETIKTAILQGQHKTHERENGELVRSQASAITSERYFRAYVVFRQKALKK